MTTTRQPNAPVAPMLRAAPDGFEDFYRARLGPTVRQTALVVGSIAVAEDVVHEAMFEVLKRWDGLDKPGGYLHRCATNGALAALRRQQAERSLPGEREPTPAPLEFVEVAELLGRLPDRQRVAVVLRYYADLTEAQIAEALGCRPGTVGPLLTRARAALQQELES